MYSPGPTIRLKISARTDKGRMRANNQDNVDVWTSDSHVLAIVADGMGGAVGGEVASKIAVESILEHFQTPNHQSPEKYYQMPEEQLGEMMAESVILANNNIVQKARREPEFKGMGTTLTMTFIRDTTAVIAHVGDSRAYLISGTAGIIEQVTTDHSFVQALVDAGHLDPNEAEDHPMKNVLYRALGQGPELDVDVMTGIQLSPGDKILLCSDGLTLHVTAPEIADIVSRGTDPNLTTDKLIDLALERGGRDNISVIVIHVERHMLHMNNVSDAQKEALSPDVTPDESILPPSSFIKSPSSNNLELFSLNQRPRQIYLGSLGEGQDTFDIE